MVGKCRESINHFIGDANGLSLKLIDSTKVFSYAQHASLSLVPRNEIKNHLRILRFDWVYSAALTLCSFDINQLFFLFSRGGVPA